MSHNAQGVITLIMGIMFMGPFVMVLTQAWLGLLMIFGPVIIMGLIEDNHEQNLKQDPRWDGRVLHNNVK